MIGLITYRTVEVLLRTKLSDPRIDSTEKVEYQDSKVTLSGDFIIISKSEVKDNKEVSTSNVVYPLDKVIAYRTSL